MPNFRSGSDQTQSTEIAVPVTFRYLEKTNHYLTPPILKCQKWSEFHSTQFFSQSLATFILCKNTLFHTKGSLK